MAVNLSPVGGVAAQFFDNSGYPLTGGKLYSYAAGTTTPAATYTSSNGLTADSNPIVLDAAGRVPAGGEIWLTDGVIYKFVLKTSTDTLIATYDNITGINSNSVAYTNQQEIITATAGQTVFPLSISYQPGTNSLSVFVDGVNQYGPGAQYSYVETDANTVTFNSGLHVGAEVKFTTTQQQGAGAVDASQVSYDPPFTGSVATNVEAKLAQYVSVMDFGAVGDGVTDDTNAVQAAVDAASAVFFPPGTYLLNTTVSLPSNVTLYGVGDASVIIAPTSGGFIFDQTNADNITIENLKFALNRAKLKFITCDNIVIRNCFFDGLWNTSNEITQQSLWFGGCNGILVEGCKFKDIRDAIYTPTENDGSGSINCDNLTVRGCKFWQDFHGLAMDYPTGVYVYYCDNASIYDCEFKDILASTGGSVGYGVYEGDGECINLTVDNCKFTSTAAADLMTGVLATRATTASITSSYFYGPMRGVEYGAKDTQVIGCTFVQAIAYFAPTSGETGYKSILVEGCTFVEAYGYAVVIWPSAATNLPFANINGNVIRNAVRSGIWISACDSPLITNNLIADCNTDDSSDQPKTSGVNFFGGPSLGFVDGNVFKNIAAGAGHMKYGVSVALTLHGVNITQNNEFINMETGTVENALSAAPTIGTWAKGTKIHYWNCSAGGVEGVICVTAGTPGTWKNFGSIAA